jgi:hypothetical protein
MRKILIDTQAFIWMMNEPERLTKAAHHIISQKATPRYVSIASPLGNGNQGFNRQIAACRIQYKKLLGDTPQSLNFYLFKRTILGLWSDCLCCTAIHLTESL